MRLFIKTLLIAFISVVVMSIATAQAATTNDLSTSDIVLVKQLVAQQRVVLSKNAKLLEKGSGALTIGDNLLVTGKSTFKKNVDVRKAIYNKKGDEVKVKDNLAPQADGAYDLGTSSLAWDNVYANLVNGVDVAALDARVEALEGATDADTTYTAGTGISIAGTTISSTVNDTNTTYAAGDGIGLSGTTFSMKGTSYDNVVVVAKSGGDYTSIQSAIDSITDEGVANKYLVWIAPGVYEEQVTLADYIYLQGASRDSVTIEYTGGALMDATTATLIMAGNSAVEDVSIVMDGSFANGIGIYTDSGSPRIQNVNVTSSGAINENHGIYVDATASPVINETTVTGIGGGADDIARALWVADPGSATITNSTFSTTGGTYYSLTMGIFSTGTIDIQDSVITSDADGASSATALSVFTAATVNIDNSTVDASNGTITNKAIDVSSGATASIRNSVIDGTDTSLSIDASTVYVANSQILATVTGAATCVGAYNSSYVALSITCGPL